MLHNITMLFTYHFHILHHLWAMKDDIIEVISNLMLKEPNSAEKRTNLAGNLFLKLNSAELMEFVFPSLLSSLCSLVQKCS